jgi:uncharacterized protein (TIRG00374 family)
MESTPPPDDAELNPTDRPPDTSAAGDDGSTSDGAAKSNRTRGIWLRIGLGLVSLVVVVVVFAFLLPQIADYRDAWEAIELLTLGQVLALIALTILTLVPFWLAFMGAFPTIRFRNAAEIHLTSTAVANTVPAGGAFAFGIQIAMLNSWKVKGDAVAAGLLVYGFWDLFLRLALPTAVATLAVVRGDLDARLQIAVAAAVVVMIALAVILWLILRSDSAATGVGKLANRICRRLPENWTFAHRNWIEVFLDFRHNTVSLLRSRGWWVGLSILAGHVATFYLLWAALRFVGVSGADVSFYRVLLAFAFVRLLIAVPITPGGAGVAELGFSAILAIGADPTTTAEIVAGVLIFRGATFLVPIPLGLGAWVTWRRGLRKTRNATEPSGAGSSGTAPEGAATRAAAPQSALPGEKGEVAEERRDDVGGGSDHESR